jgi:hypothetical protein
VAVEVGIEGSKEGAVVVAARAHHRHLPMDAEDVMDNTARAA